MEDGAGAAPWELSQAAAVSDLDLGSGALTEQLVPVRTAGLRARLRRRLRCAFPGCRLP